MIFTFLAAARAFLAKVPWQLWAALAAPPDGPRGPVQPKPDDQEARP